MWRRFVSRVLFLTTTHRCYSRSFLWDVRHHTPQATYPFCRKAVHEPRTPLPETEPIWFFNTRGLPRCMSPYNACALTTRFHPYPNKLVAVCFCCTFRLYSSLNKAFPLGSELLCVARTFLCSFIHSDQPICFAKVVNWCIGAVVNW